MPVLQLKSPNQILGNMIAVLKAQTGITDFNNASVTLNILEAASAEDFEQYVRMIDIIRNYNLDTTTGTDLDNRGFEYGLTRFAAQKAIDGINILRQVGFVKVSTILYSGQPSPVQGTTQLFVNDASNALFGTSGTLIVGRGTSNLEQVTYTAAPVNNTNFWTFTTSPFANNHGLDESVILAQGSDVVITAGTLLRVLAQGTAPEIDFTVNQDTTLLSGESEVDGVLVTCTVAGSIGNIPIGAINGTQAFANPPFSGARAYNPQAFTTGQDLETDDAFRDRIKNTIQSLSKGTATSIENAIVGLVDVPSAKRVVSASIVQPTTLQDDVKIYIDDGTGFEPSFDQQGYEVIVPNASGGEQRLQLQNFPVVKAQLETQTSQPYDMSAGTLALTYTVGGLQTETIDFQLSDFQFPASAKAQEIVVAINNRSTLLQARTANGGTDVVITAIVDTNEDLQVTGGAANAILNFPTTQISTLYLYKNSKLLSKDGSTAFVDSLAQTYDFASLGGTSWDLSVRIDGKSTNQSIIIFRNTDFAVPGAATAQEVVTVLNAQLAGGTASLIDGGTRVRMTSNTPLSSLSKIKAGGGGANDVLGFSTTEVVGTNSDYTFNRFLGQIQLNAALVAGDNVSAGSLSTRGFLETTSPETYTITSGQTLVVKVDGGSSQTITFSASSSFTAQQVCDLINAQLAGATATVIDVNGSNFVVLTTNTQDAGTGSIEVLSSSTATALDFPTNTIESSIRPDKAYVVAVNAGPYTLALNKTLIVVLDNSPATETYLINLAYPATLTAVTDASNFKASALTSVFTNPSDLQSFFLIATSGALTGTGNVSSVSAVSGSTWEYNFATLPAFLSTASAGDNVTFSGLQNVENNGDFLITAISTSGAGYVRVTNAVGSAETGSTGSALMAERRQVSTYSQIDGSLTLAAPFSSAPAIGDTMSLIPYTTANMVSFLNNIKVTPLSTNAVAEAVDQGMNLQISSLQNGSDGYVQVAGGSANSVFGFPTSTVHGLQAYEYYTGLLKLVHKTVYGDDSDSVSFPGYGAAGIQFDIQAPTVNDISFSITLTLANGVSISAVSDLVKSAVTQYVDGLGLGDDVILSEIVAAILQVTGITDVKIVAPTQNVVIIDNELPRTTDALIVLG